MSLLASYMSFKAAVSIISAVTRQWEAMDLAMRAHRVGLSATAYAGKVARGELVQVGGAVLKAGKEADTAAKALSKTSSGMNQLKTAGAGVVGFLGGWVGVIASIAASLIFTLIPSIGEAPSRRWYF